MEYDKTNSGVLFKNDKKADNHPDYKGTINVNGKEFSLGAWLKTSAKGNKFMSLKVSEPFVKGDAPKPQKKVEFDEDIPF